MRYKFAIIVASLLLLVVVAAARSKPDFSGSWVMDRGRSFGLPGDMNQTMEVKQTAEQIEVETKLIQPGNERNVKDVYILDGKEHEFTPPAAAGQTPPKGKRTANWLADKGIVVDEVTTADTPKGPVTTRVVRKWTMTAADELTISLYVDSPTVSYEAKRIFKKK